MARRRGPRGLGAVLALAAVAAAAAALLTAAVAVYTLLTGARDDGWGVGNSSSAGSMATHTVHTNSVSLLAGVDAGSAGARGGGGDTGPADPKPEPTPTGPYIVVQRNSGRLNNQLASLDVAMRLAKAMGRTLVVASPTHMHQMDGLVSVHGDVSAGLWDARALDAAGFKYVMEHELPIGHELRREDRPMMGRLLTLIMRDRNGPRNNFSETGPTVHPLLPGVRNACLIYTDKFVKVGEKRHGRPITAQSIDANRTGCSTIFLMTGETAMTCDNVDEQFGEHPQTFDAFFNALRPSPRMREQVDAFYRWRHVATPSVGVHSRVFMEGAERDPEQRRAIGLELCGNIVLHRGGPLRSYLQARGGFDSGMEQLRKACRLTPQIANECLRAIAEANGLQKDSLEVSPARPWVRATDRYDRLLDAQAERAGAVTFGVKPGAYAEDYDDWSQRCFFANGTRRPRSKGDRGGGGGAMWARPLLSKTILEGKASEEAASAPEVGLYGDVIGRWFKDEDRRGPPRDAFLPARWGQWYSCTKPDGRELPFHECPLTAHQAPRSFAEARGSWRDYLIELQYVIQDMYAVARADYFVGNLASSFAMSVCSMRGAQAQSRSNVCEMHFGLCSAPR